MNVAASPGGDDPRRDPSSILAKFDLFSDSLKKNAKELLPHAVRDKTHPRRPGQGYGGGRGGPNDPNDPFGSPGGRDSNVNNRSPPNLIPTQHAVMQTLNYEATEKPMW
eukprot:4193021-Amphidinium_carterae.1